MKRDLTQSFLAAGFLLFLSQGAHAYGINMLRQVDLPIGAGGNQAVLIRTLPQTSEASKTGVLHIVLDTSSTASANEVSPDSESSGTGNGTSAINTGLVGNATGGTTNYAPTFSGGNVGIRTTSPTTGMRVDIGGPVKAPGTGSKACSASNIGAMRYNPTGNYLEICSYP